MNEKLQPMTLGEILDRTAQIYRRNFWTFAGVSAVPVVAMFAISVPIGVVMGLMGVFKAGKPAPNTEIVGIVLVAMLIALPVLIVVSVVSQAALTKTAIGTHMGQKITVREAIKSVWPRFWRYAWIIVLLALLVGILPGAVTTIAVALLMVMERGGSFAGSLFIGFLMFLVIAAGVVYIIWRGLCYSMAFSACIVEEKTGWQSIKRANQLSRGTRWRILVMYLLVLAISVVISIISDVFLFAGIAIATALGGSKYGPVAAVVGEALNLVANFALQTLITPVSLIALVLFYFDQRVRTEGYDIELMMEQAGLTTTPATPVPQAEAEPLALPLLTPVPESPLMPSFEPGPGPDTVKE
ncbi:MAG: hypothetical protein ABR928_03825 [Terracidiphilus sp.]|jgi:hypothetical protein